MPGPDVVRIKRKRNDQAPEALLVERPGKRQQTADVHYVLQRDATNKLFDTTSVKRQVESRDGQTGRRKSVHASGNGLDGTNRERRTFHLKRPTTPEAGVRKRRHKDDGIATFIEKQVKRNAQDLFDLAQREQHSNSEASASTPAPEPPLKRPGRGAAIRADADALSKTRPSNVSSHAKADSRIEAMANSLHRFAMEEAAKEAPPKPKITSQPKLPPARSRELHRQRLAQSMARTADSKANDDVDMDEDADYVYDTYVLAPSSGVGATQIDAQDAVGNVGYLVITEEDEDVWGTYLEDDPSEPSDEEDENAEDWYGADYPDDELASDDEFGRNPYHYRTNGSDDEWEESGAFSDEEYERQTNPWRNKSSQQFSKYFSGIENEAEE